MRIDRIPFLSMALVLLIVIGCGGEDFEIDYSGFDCIANNPNFDPEPIPAPAGNHQLRFTPNKTIAVNGTDPENGIDIVNGRNRVFQYRYQLQDTQLDRQLYFEIEPGIDSFTVSDSSLADINTYLARSCDCPDSPQGVFAVEQGCIIGQRLDANNWEVSINITVHAEGETLEIMATAVFQK